MGERKRPANCGNKAYTLFDSLRLCHSTTCLWPDYAVRHANMAAGVLPDAARRATTHAADRYGSGADAASEDLTLTCPGTE